MKNISLVLMLGTFVLTGCSMLPQPGPLAGKDVAVIESSIINSKTTQAELVSLYGDKPTVEITPEGKKVINWYKTWSSGFTQETTVLSVLSDNDIVTRHVVLRYKSSSDYSFVDKLTDAELKSVIIPGETTRQTIEAKYGKPNDNSFDDEGNRIMLYIYADASRSKYDWIPNVGGFIEALAGSVSVDVKALKIPLDNNEKAKGYQIKNTKYRQGIGLLNSSKLEVVE